MFLHGMGLFFAQKNRNFDLVIALLDNLWYNIENQMYIYMLKLFG